MAAEAFVPDDFDVPQELVTSEFRLEPLGPQHNDADYAAWTSSMEHIAATPGFEDFANRAGFTYTVLAGDDDRVVGCVYIYPADSAGVADVRSWVRADRADLDVPLHDAVAFWLTDAWPFEAVSYAPRS